MALLSSTGIIALFKLTWRRLQTSRPLMAVRTMPKPHLISYGYLLSVNHHWIIPPFHRQLLRSLTSNRLNPMRLLQDPTIHFYGSKAMHRGTPTFEAKLYYCPEWTKFQKTRILITSPRRHRAPWEQQLSSKAIINTVQGLRLHSGPCPVGPWLTNLHRPTRPVTKVRMHLL